MRKRAGYHTHDSVKKLGKLEVKFSSDVDVKEVYWDSGQSLQIALSMESTPLGIFTLEYL